jgi:hypothetical protein
MGGSDMKSLYTVLVTAVTFLVIVGCAAGPNELVDSPNMEGQVAGFWQGLWHGIISPITFLVSLFSENLHMYEVHNNGGWYNFGFLLGVSIIFGGGGGGAGCRRSRRRQ